MPLRVQVLPPVPVKVPSVVQEPPAQVRKFSHDRVPPAGPVAEPLRVHVPPAQLLAVMGFFLQRSRDTDTGLRLPLPDQAAALI